ncbi:glycosyltransferase family 1 protein [Rhodoferax sp. PAMC 29310]|uniref:glycosyltransferase family 4 protein n=1 Tax=Rhodoferax sp. PAMC 29310 TaxID=2822760 RepID=UPI001B3221B7|nr:glycosyltransferase family 1 protein [Rhodoferax sp. PAMC 29310]
MQFFYDVSELAQLDHQTGIQRVVRSILAQLLANPPEGFTVEPVVAHRNEEGYYYARRFTQAFLGLTVGEGNSAIDAPIDPHAGDIFLRLELQPEVVMMQSDYYADLRSLGVKVFFGVHDLLPIWMPQYFPGGTEENHTRWLGRLARADGVVCVSRSVADEVAQWLNLEGPKRLRPLKLGWFHLGADLAGSVPTKGLPEDALRMVAALSKCPNFLMVGTIEPRKGHMQTLAAFEQLWNSGVKVNLVVVGRHGWHMEAFVTRLKTHPEQGRHLHWPENVSDEYLDQIYAASTCLLAPSEGEGFGLPLIEAARHQLPIIARNLPVFREVAGDHAYYFSGLAPSALAYAVENWLRLNAWGQAPQSTHMPRQTWQQSTAQLLDVLLGGQWYKDWTPDGVIRMHGSDPRFLSKFGRRSGRHMHSTGQAGHLVYGPYLYLAPGRYEVRIKGSFAGKPGPNPNIEVAAGRGNRVLARGDLYSDCLGDYCERTLVFDAESDCADVEVRVWVEACNVVTLTLIEVHRIAATQPEER